MASSAAALPRWPPTWRSVVTMCWRSIVSRLAPDETAGAGGAPKTSGGRSSGWISSPFERITARSMAWSSSRTLPGHAYPSSTARARGPSRLAPYVALATTKWLARSAMSSRRSRRGGEGALLVAEELRLEHFTRQGAAVDGDEGPPGSRRALVDRARHQLLAGTARAQDEHRGVGGRNPLDDPEDLLHLGTLGEDATERLGARGVRAQRLVVAEELGLLRGLADEDVELLDLHGLGEVVVGAELHRLDRRGDLLEAGHHDHLRMLGEGLELAQDLDTLLLRHLHVEDHDVVRRRHEPLERRGAVADAVHVVPLARELAHDELAQVALVVGDQEPDLATHAGSTTRKRLPLPGREVPSIRPPWSVTIPWAMASPRPVPCPGGLVVKNGSKIRGRTSSGTPGPSSSNSTSTSPRCRRERTVSRPRPSIASSAFEARAMKTWRIWPSLTATAGGTWSSSATHRPSAKRGWWKRSSVALRTSALVSVGARRLPGSRTSWSRVPVISLHRDASPSISPR